MAEDPRARRRDGVTIAPGRSPGKAWLALAGAAAVAGLALFVLFRSPAPPDRAAARETAVAAAPADRAPDPPLAANAPERPGSSVRLRERAHLDEPAAAREGTGRSGDDAGTGATTPTGIALFPPRGSDPVRVGLVVPDGFELPEGFARHYQVTDDGQELPPILIVHPDYELLDAHGRPVPRPEGGVVPPELAPAGMPIHELVVPEPPDESGP